MAFVATAISPEPKAYSIGPYKEEVFNCSAVSGDVAGTITSANLSRVDFVIVCMGGINLTAQPTISGTTVTLAFADPVANRFGQVILRGK